MDDLSHKYFIQYIQHIQQMCIAYKNESWWSKAILYLYLTERLYLKNYGHRLVKINWYSHTSGPLFDNYKDYILNIDDEPDFDYFSKASLEYLDLTLYQYKDLSFDELKNKCKGMAWQIGYENETGYISPLDMAKELNISEACIYLLKEQLEIDNFILTFSNNDNRAY